MVRALILSLLLAAQVSWLAGSSAGAQSADTHAAWPTTCEEAIEKILSAIGPDDRAYLGQFAKDDLVRFHFGWGMGIRNDFGLWGGNVALAQDCRARFGRPDARDGLDPDSISMLIIEQVWLRVQ